MSGNISLATQWQQMMVFLQRVEQEPVTSQNLADAIENKNRTRIDATGNRLRLTDGERLYPKSWSGSTSLVGFARESAAWLGYVDPQHEAEKLIQKMTKGALRATEAWTDDRHAAHDTRVELDSELANATEGAARSTVLKVTKVEPSHGFVARQALVDGYAPKSSNDPATALQPTLAVLAEYEHQFKMIDEAQKTFRGEGNGAE